VFELETVLAFGVGAGLVALAPMVRRLGSAARSVARHAAEAAESLGDLVAEARTELDTPVVEAPVAAKKPAASRAKKQVTVTDVTVE